MFEKSKWIRLPRSVVVGHGVLDRAVEVVEQLYLDGRPLIVTSPTPEELAADRLVDSFENAGFDPSVVVVEEATFSAVESVIEAADETDAAFLIGLGGGTPIDIATPEETSAFTTTQADSSRPGLIDPERSTSSSAVIFESAPAYSL